MDLFEEFLISAKQHYKTIDKKINLCYNLNKTCINIFNEYKYKLQISSFNIADENEKFKIIKEIFMQFLFYHVYFYNMVREIILETIKDVAIQKHVLRMKADIDGFSEILKSWNIEINPMLLEIYNFLCKQTARMDEMKEYLKTKNFDFKTIFEPFVWNI